MAEERTKSMTIIPLSSTFGAEIRHCDPSQLITDEDFQDILKAITKYGFCVFRNTLLDDLSHVTFASRFGELDSRKAAGVPVGVIRVESPELTDVSNMENDGTLIDPASFRGAFNKGNNVFHVDNSYNARRASYSLLRACELPPAGTGGSTEFADTRQAFDDLPDEWKNDLLEKNYVACHSIWHSRKLASPEILDQLVPEKYPMSRHKLVQKHEPSGRMNLYIASHCHHIEGLSEAESKAKLEFLYCHATQPKYTVAVPWENNGDMIIWDNTCVMHRASGGVFEGKYRRDMRRATVLDGSTQAWGLNSIDSKLDGWEAMFDVMKQFGYDPRGTTK